MGRSRGIGDGSKLNATLGPANWAPIGYESVGSSRADGH